MKFRIITRLNHDRREIVYSLQKKTIFGWMEIYYSCTKNWVFSELESLKSPILKNTFKPKILHEEELR